MKSDEREVRRIVRDRSGGACEICGVPAESMHHRRFRSQGGPWAPSNILHLCGDGVRLCHGLLTVPQGRREEFERNGWIVPSWRLWATYPVVYREYEQMVFLGDDGGLRPATSGELMLLGFGYTVGGEVG